MATNNNINYGPAAIPGTVTTPVLGNNIDRAPAPVDPGAGTGYIPTVTQPVIPVTEQPVINPPIVTRTTTPVIPVVEQSVAVVANVTAGDTVAAGNQQRYITILANGTVVTNNASTLDFEGNGFTITTLGTNGAVITLSGAAGYGNSNVATLLAAFGSNTLSTTGNVTAGYILGNGSQLTGLAATYGNADVAAYLPTYTGNLAALAGNVITTANISANNVTVSNLVNVLYNGNDGLTIDVSNPTASLVAAAGKTITIGADNGNAYIGLGQDNVFGGPGSILMSGNISGGNLDATNLVINRISSDDSTFVTIDDGVNVVGDVNLSGDLVFSPTQVQSSAYAGGNGHAMMIDTNRTDTYVEIGSADKPFKTFAAAIAAVAAENPTGTVPYTFILMGCNINETVDFTPYNFNFITISTTCRSTFNDPVIFGNSNLLQLTVRNVEFGDTVAITGNGTANQLNNTSFYNVTFTGALTVTAANALAFYEAAFFSTVAFNNVSYCYVNGGQFNDDWTIRVDDTGSYPIPSSGIAPGVVLALDFIANDINFVKGGTGVGVFQPHSSRMGRTGQTYTLPASWILTSYSSAFLGNWVNDGTWTMRNSVNVVAIANTAPTYSGIIGGTTITATGNVTGGNVLTGGLISATANVTGGNVTTAGNISTDWLNIGNIGNIAVLAADVKLQITADAASNNAPYWTFNNDGTLYVPGNISGDNGAPLIVEASGSGEGYISLPHATFGGEQVAIVNKFSLGNGIRLETNGGNLFFDNTGILSVPGNIIMPPGTALKGSGASPSPSISGFSSVSAVDLSAAGNITGGNISATGNITGNTAGYTIGYRDIPQISLSSNVTTALTDAGKHYYSTSASNLALTIANNTSVVWPVGTAISIVNRGTANITIAPGSGVSLYLAGNSTSANRTVTTYGMATVMNVAANVWMINGTVV
jgi:hypothetical protein